MLSSPQENMGFFNVDLKETFMQTLIIQANKKVSASQQAYVAAHQRSQHIQSILSKIFALETWRRRQHEHLIFQLEQIIEELDSRLVSTIQEKSLVISDHETLQKELASTSSTVALVEQRNASLIKANHDLKKQTESLINTVVALTHENKSLRERDAELSEKLEEAEMRVTKLLAIKSERVLNNSCFLPIGTRALRRPRRHLGAPSGNVANPLTERVYLLSEHEASSVSVPSSTTITPSNRSLHISQPNRVKKREEEEEEEEVYITQAAFDSTSRKELKNGIKRKQADSKESKAQDMAKRKPGMLHSHSVFSKGTSLKDSSALDPRTPLRDRLRSRSKKA